MSELRTHKKFNHIFSSLIKFQRFLFPLLLLFCSNPYFIGGRAFLGKSGNRIFFASFDLPVSAITEVIKTGDEIVINHTWRNLFFCPRFGAILSSPHFNPSSLLIVEEVSLPPH